MDLHAYRHDKVEIPAKKFRLGRGQATSPDPSPSDDGAAYRHTLPGGFSRKNYIVSAFTAILTGLGTVQGGNTVLCDVKSRRRKFSKSGPALTRKGRRSRRRAHITIEVE